MPHPPARSIDKRVAWASARTSPLSAADSFRLVAFVPKTELERRIVADPEWQEGAAWGDSRPGHPEGKVIAHIEEVLNNVDGLAVDENDRERLRLVALIHDTFKYRVVRGQPRTGENHHAMIARRFAERYIDDRELLDVIELHDEAYDAWVKGERGDNWPAAVERARALIGQTRNVPRLLPSLLPSRQRHRIQESDSAPMVRARH